MLTTKAYTKIIEMHALYTLIIFKFINVKGGHRESIEYIYQHLKF